MPFGTCQPHALWENGADDRCIERSMEWSSWSQYSEMIRPRSHQSFREKYSPDLYYQCQISRRQIGKYIVIRISLKNYSSTISRAKVKRWTPISLRTRRNALICCVLIYRGSKSNVLNEKDGWRAQVVAPTGHVGPGRSKLHLSTARTNNFFSIFFKINVKVANVGEVVSGEVN